MRQTDGFSYKYNIETNLNLSEVKMINLVNQYVLVIVEDNMILESKFVNKIEEHNDNKTYYYKSYDSTKNLTDHVNQIRQEVRGLNGF